MSMYKAKATYVLSSLNQKETKHLLGPTLRALADHNVGGGHQHPDIAYFS